MKITQKLEKVFSLVREEIPKAKRREDLDALAHKIMPLIQDLAGTFHGMLKALTEEAIIASKKRLEELEGKEEAPSKWRPKKGSEKPWKSVMDY